MDDQDDDGRFREEVSSQPMAIQITGDMERGKELITTARRFMGQLHAVYGIGSDGSTGYYKKAHTLADGSLIEVSHNQGVELVRIMTPQRHRFADNEVTSVQEAPPEPVLSPHEYPEWTPPQPPPPQIDDSERKKTLATGKVSKREYCDIPPDEIWTSPAITQGHVGFILNDGTVHISVLEENFNYNQRFLVFDAHMVQTGEYTIPGGDSTTMDGDRIVYDHITQKVINGAYYDGDGTSHLVTHIAGVNDSEHHALGERLWRFSGFVTSQPHASHSYIIGHGDAKYYILDAESLSLLTTVDVWPAPGPGGTTLNHSPGFEYGTAAGFVTASGSALMYLVYGPFDMLPLYFWNRTTGSVSTISPPTPLNDLATFTAVMQNDDQTIWLREHHYQGGDTLYRLDARGWAQVEVGSGLGPSDFEFFQGRLGHDPITDAVAVICNDMTGFWIYNGKDCQDTVMAPYFFATPDAPETQQPKTVNVAHFFDGELLLRYGAAYGSGGAYVPMVFVKYTIGKLKQTAVAEYEHTADTGVVQRISKGEYDAGDTETEGETS